MSETTKILLTTCATLAGGTLLFCATTLLTKLVFEPILTFRKTLGEISYCLQYYGWLLPASGSDERFAKELFQKGFDDLRSFTARLRADASGILGYNIFARLGWLPRYPQLIEGCGRLIRICNNWDSEQSDEMQDDLRTVERLLRIDIGRPA